MGSTRRQRSRAIGGRSCLRGGVSAYRAEHRKTGWILVLARGRIAGHRRFPSNGSGANDGPLRAMDDIMKRLKAEFPGSLGMRG